MPPYTYGGLRTIPAWVPGLKLRLSGLHSRHLDLQNPPTGPSSVIASVSLHRIPSELPHCANLPAFTLVLFRFSSSTWKLP